MYKHILLPTDGSPLAARGARAGVQLAQASPKEHKQFSHEAAQKAFAPIEAAQVRCDRHGLARTWRTRRRVRRQRDQRVLAHSKVPVLVIR
jgi:nucleotide-binding universal stress UspA family protein